MPKGDRRYEDGLAIRRDVMGADVIDRRMAEADDFSAPLQDHINEFCWGVAWTRDGLDRRTRSLITIAIVGALGRSFELELHAGGAIRNGATVEEIREVLIQLAVYAGVPAGVDAFKAAARGIAASDG